MVKLLMTWDIKSGREEAYFEFVVKELVPGLIELGIRPMEAWYTIYGDVPQILAGWVAEDQAIIEKALRSEDWSALQKGLLTLVDNFQRKIVPATGLFQL